LHAIDFEAHALPVDSRRGIELKLYSSQNGGQVSQQKDSGEEVIHQDERLTRLISAEPPGRNGSQHHLALTSLLPHTRLQFGAPKPSHHADADNKAQGLAFPPFTAIAPSLPLNQRLANIELVGL
jgi:hypothetical protein